MKDSIYYMNLTKSKLADLVVAADKKLIEAEETDRLLVKFREANASAHLKILEIEPYRAKYLDLGKASGDVINALEIINDLAETLKRRSNDKMLAETITLLSIGIITKSLQTINLIENQLEKRYKNCD